VSRRHASRWKLVLGLLLTAAVPAAVQAVREPPGPRCATDGVSLAQAPVVRVEAASGDTRSFCCVTCAETWLRATPAAPAQVVVTDGPTGRPLDLGEAWFVRSRVVAQPATGDRMHAFADKQEALRHADAYGGRLLTGWERPFAALSETARREP